MITKKAENLRAGDMFVSCMSRTDGNYPPGQPIADVIHLPSSTIVHFADGSELEIMDGMKVLIEEEL